MITIDDYIFNENSVLEILNRNHIIETRRTPQEIKVNTI
jgi:hypothetical protein